MRHFINPAIEAYACEHTSKPAPVLQQLERTTHLKVLLPQMISGHVQGAVLRMISYMVQPKQVLEIGTFTGYATICLCAGLQKGGQVHTIEINEELTKIQTQAFETAGVQNLVQQYVGSALEVIPEIDAIFDLVFIDADKRNNAAYFDMVLEKVRPGGFILTDNILWKGKVLEKEMDKKTKFADHFNKKIHAHPMVENVLLPILDGIMIARKLVS
ncbi:MAG: O-methyltransferase [Chitinophagales bacterium]